MSKLILFLSFLSLTFLFIGGLLFPGNSTMWLAADGTGYAILRLTMMIVLLALLITNPPRNISFRIFVGFLSTGLGVWALTSTYQNNMQVLDGASIMLASISMAIAALEYNYEPEPIDLEMLRLAKRTRSLEHKVKQA